MEMGFYFWNFEKWKKILVNLTSKNRFNEYENVIFIDGKTHFLGNVDFIKSDDPSMWDTIKSVPESNTKINLKFKKLSSKSIRENYIFANVNFFCQAIGFYEGFIELNGEKIEISLNGVAEKHYAMW